MNADAPTDRCKERVPYDSWGRDKQCARKAIRDGFCKQHHPDSVKARRELSEARYMARSAALAAPYQQAEKLKQENLRLREALKHLCNVVYFDINGALPISVSKALNAAVSALDDTAQ